MYTRNLNILGKVYSVSYTYCIRHVKNIYYCDTNCKVLVVCYNNHVKVGHVTISHARYAVNLPL